MAAKYQSTSCLLGHNLPFSSVECSGVSSVPCAECDFEWLRDSGLLNTSRVIYWSCIMSWEFIRDISLLLCSEHVYPWDPVRAAGQFVLGLKQLS